MSLKKANPDIQIWKYINTKKVNNLKSSERGGESRKLGRFRPYSAYRVRLKNDPKQSCWRLATGREPGSMRLFNYRAGKRTL